MQMKLFTQRNRVFFISISLIFTLVFLSLSQLYGFFGSNAKVLVLGFNSRHFNDLQDRLLREIIIRKFHTRGYNIVTVMEIESIIQEDSRIKIRRLKRDKIRKLCTQMHADYVVTGSIYLKNNIKSKHKITKNFVYRCKIVLYQRSKNRFIEKFLENKGSDKIYGFFKSLSEKIVTISEEYID